MNTFRSLKWNSPHSEGSPFGTRSAPIEALHFAKKRLHTLRLRGRASNAASPGRGAADPLNKNLGTALASAMRRSASFELTKRQLTESPLQA